MQAMLELGCWSMTVLGPGHWLKGKVQACGPAQASSHDRGVHNVSCCRDQGEPAGAAGPGNHQDKSTAEALAQGMHPKRSALTILPSFLSTMSPRMTKSG